MSSALPASNAATWLCSTSASVRVLSCLAQTELCWVSSAYSGCHTRAADVLIAMQSCLMFIAFSPKFYVLRYELEHRVRCRQGTGAAVRERLPSSIGIGRYDHIVV